MSTLQTKEKTAGGNPYLQALQQFEADFPIIENGALITLRDKSLTGYITAAGEDECSAEEMEGCAVGEHAGCVKLNNITADHIQIHMVGSTTSDGSIPFSSEVALQSKVLSHNHTHGYYLGICKASHAHESNGKLYWFHQVHHNLIMSNVLFTIAWEDTAQPVLRSKTKCTFHSPVANGYLLADQRNISGMSDAQQGRLEEMYFDVTTNQALWHKSKWIVELESNPE